MNKYLKGDTAIWLILIVLAIFSLLSVYSASGMLAYKFQGGNTTYYLMKHSLLLIFAFMIIFIVHKIPYNFIGKLSKPLFYLSVLLLFLTLIIGANLNQASRWLVLPGGVFFQTSDFAKVATIIYLARVLSRNKNELTNFREVLKKIILPVLIVCAMIFPADFSTAALLFASIVVLMFIANLKWKYIFATVGIALAAGFFFVLLSLALPNFGRVDTWKARIESFTSGESESNFQADHSRVAIASGGFLPNGPGQSVQRNILPHPYSDFIYAIIVEEYGIILGGLTIPLLYLILFYRSLRIVRRAKSSFSAFMVSGLAVLIVIQAFVNMMVAVNLIPVTGQTLPFVSMGGTSMVFYGIAFGLILSVSRSVQDESVKHELNPENSQKSESYDG